MGNVIWIWDLAWGRKAFVLVLLQIVIPQLVVQRVAKVSLDNIVMSRSSSYS
jgi:hypothetical protein